MAIVAGLIYLTFLAVLSYAILFLGNLGAPRSIDIGPAAAAHEAWLIDTALVTLLALLHGALGRLRWPAARAGMARGIHALIASVALAALFIGWRPLAGSVWALGDWEALSMQALFYVGWTLVLISVLFIHGELLGESPRAHGSPRPLEPLYPGLALALWATPSMTVGHLLLALLASVYLLLSAVLEARRSHLLIGRSARIVEGQEIDHEHPSTQQRAGPCRPRLARLPP